MKFRLSIWHVPSIIAAAAVVGFISMLAYLPLPARAQQVGQLNCSQSVIYDASTNGPTQLVANASQSQIYICGFLLTAGGTANVKLEYGTGTACATGETALTPAFPMVTQMIITDSAPMWRGLRVPPAKNLCINASAGVAVQAIVFYSQQ